MILKMIEATKGLSGLESIQENPNGGWWLSRKVTQARSRIRDWRRRAATIAIGVLALVMAYGVVFGHNGLFVYAQKRAEAKQLETLKVELKQENDRLKEHADRLESDPSAIEHEAREELHYTRAGEVIVTLPVQASGVAVVTRKPQ